MTHNLSFVSNFHFRMYKMIHRSFTFLSAIVFISRPIVSEVMVAKYQTVVNQVPGYLVPSVGQQIMQIMGHGHGIGIPNQFKGETFQFAQIR